MDAATLVSEVEANRATELDRLGSSKLLIALTDAALDPEAVLMAAADGEAVARRTFSDWAADESRDDARAAFESVAAQEGEHLDRIAAELDGYEPATDPDPMHAYLRGLSGTVERVAGGLVGRVLVGERTHGQFISFFVNEADERRADLFRDLRTDTESDLDEGRRVLDRHCTEADWTAARDTAERTISMAYDAYSDSLDELGVDPKPVC